MTNTKYNKPKPQPINMMQNFYQNWIPNKELSLQFIVDGKLDKKKYILFTFVDFRHF